MTTKRHSMAGRGDRMSRAARGAAAAAILLTPILAPTLAMAQLDTRSPIDLSADSSTVDNANCTSQWKGSVEALQGRTRPALDGS